MNILQINKYGIKQLKQQYSYPQYGTLNIPSFNGSLTNSVNQAILGQTDQENQTLDEKKKFLEELRNSGLSLDQIKVNPEFRARAEQLFGASNWFEQVQNYFTESSKDPYKKMFGSSYLDFEEANQNFQGNELLRKNPNPQPQLTYEQFQQQEQSKLNELQLQSRNNLEGVLSSQHSGYDSVGKVGDTALNTGRLAGQVFSGVNFDLGESFQNVNLGKIIGNTANGVQASINSIKNLRNINNAVKATKDAGTELSKTDLKNIQIGNAAGAMGIVGAAAGIADSFLGDRSEYSGDYGGVTKTLDSVYDGISDAAMSFGPIGMIVGGAMKGADLLGDVMGKLGGGTDGMTAQDAILGSSFFSWNVGLINGFGGSTTDTIKKDEEAFAQVGSSYSGTGSMVDDALTKSGKKYGLFSKNAYNKAQSLINESKRQQNVMAGIAADATDRFAIRDSMNQINAERRNVALNGGYRQANVRVGRHGMLIERAREILNTSFIKELEVPNVASFIEEVEIPEFKLGGSLVIESCIEELQVPTYIEELSIEIFKEGGQVETEQKRQTISGGDSSVDVKNNNEDVGYDGIIDPIEYSLKRFPILANLPQISLQYDPNFTPDEYDLEYMEAKYDTLPDYHNYKKLKQFRGKSTIVYNDDVNNEAIALDWLSHGLREYDPKYQEYLQRLSEDETWKSMIMDQLFGKFLSQRGISNIDYRKLSKNKKQRLIDEFKELEINQEQFNSVLDGLIRGLLVRTDTENNNSYAPEEERQLLRNTEIWKEVEKYLTGKIEQYKLGGKVNVIPEGALHARLHHMDEENITKKGIPVVSETEDGLEQQAEIEVNEIIFRLEVTKRLEKLQKEYYNEETTQKRKDELAIEAGKILTYEILYNTQDNTNLINEIK